MARRHLRLPFPLLSRNPTPLARHALCTSTLETPAAAVETPEQATEEAVEGAAAPNLPRREEPLHETILHMIRRRPWTTRLETSIRLHSPSLDAPLVHGVISGAAATGRADLALQFFRFAYRRAGFRPEPATFALLVPILASRRMLNHARCLLLDTMPSFSIAPDEATLAALIAAYGKAAIPQEAVKLFRMMPDLGIPRTALSYNAVLKAILCRGREAMARRIYNAMIADGVAPDVSTYNTLIWGFGLCKKMESAVRVFGDMKGHGVTPDVTTYNTLLNAWVRAGDLESARKVFDEMTGAGIERNSVSYNVMIRGYVASGKVEEAVGLFTEMGEKGVRLSEKTFAALMPGLCDDQGKVAEAQKAIDNMAERRLTPKDKSVFLRLVTTLCRAGDLDGALEVHRKSGKFKHVLVDLRQYGVLMEGLCAGRKFDSAVEVLDELMEKGTLLSPKSPVLEASAYNPVIEHLCNNGSTNKAETFFRQLMKKGVDDKVAFNNLIRGHAKEGVPEAAQEILTIMARRGIPTDPESHALLVNSFLKKNEPADAKIALDSMMEQGHLPSPSLFKSVMVALFNDGRVQTASRVLKSMIEKRVTENMDIAHKILETLFMRGHVEEAIGRVNLMVENGCMPDLDKLLVGLCENDRVMEAQKLADFALDRDFDVGFSTYDRVLEALYTEEKTLPAYSMLCKIKNKGGVVDQKGCDALLESLKSEGYSKQADILSRILMENAPSTSKKGKRVAMGA
ncbi:large ribosomal subunit protein mL102 (rPPR5)-like [Phragmites australis]|uniref:large ribosomal subunit protein mL102 (rPPR5)-like n=1 Tax=Phragmites australis TaxID=29695 RepID=UPI002D77F46C|nr:large ribosomal subunit protein mL102 (rPPR5)-like [Phragmites australis]XP_062224347.1 large ribosomal subunit protein mL102 (rPPR5)-like [Phragmites australis]